MDYMADGLDVELVVAIDFTNSNGDPTDPRFVLKARTPTVRYRRISGP